MAIIGNFSKKPDGSYIGEIITLSVQSRNVIICPDNTVDANRRCYAVKVGDAVIGSGFAIRPKEDGSIIRLEIDDPSFAAPISADLIDSLDASLAVLVWSRRSDK